MRNEVMMVLPANNGGTNTQRAQTVGRQDGRVCESGRQRDTSGVSDPAH